MTYIVNRLAHSWHTRKDLDYYLVRASMVIVFLFFGYQLFLLWVIISTRCQP
jgi:hypothetical protein